MVNPSSRDYTTFWQTLTAYRQTAIFNIFSRFNLADCISSLPATERSSSAICKHVGWNLHAGERMLDCFCHEGLLEKLDQYYNLSDFSSCFFLTTSPDNQSSTILFEKFLKESWDTLENVLVSGEKVYKIEDKTNHSLQELQHLFIGAMDDAANVRAQELWNSLEWREKGTIVDFGAGSGAYLIHFLSKHDQWKGIFCDLEDIIAIAGNNSELKKFNGRLGYYGCNLLDEDDHLDPILFSHVDIILFSNFIHCYSSDILKIILDKISFMFEKEITIIIHDFFKDLNWQSSLYDIHMMLNTYNGKVYSTREVIAMLREFGFREFKLNEYPSKSAAIIAKN